ncbi:MAG: hypothetical protein A2925_04800 [Candidatus Yanofskybacteria bacterium RIFCSPLOWO2_01_FULL_44_22]|uniref:Uncharacterized protein n=2 Tax=Candidatus Yanofskyibacteriota TaxID=1752733 RepID=A0A1F8GMX3_9BACT|nr:MAG: hypothetical protein UW79_C0027G0002 [Candidatus Yanofskybacteria bacterium GW2011_GWA2_44_9]OGN26018.1 MAG: hypothetical protein A2925_04800 [Candidatus Yanofskybacteria bacterium RIFCSPLOWO2_01_FULL_44_22]
MVIKDLKKHISKNYPGLNVSREIDLYKKYTRIARVEESIKKDLIDFARLCCQEEWDRTFNIEIFLGPDHSDNSYYRKERAVGFVVADNYLRSLLEKKIIQKYSIERKQSKYSVNYASIKTRISLKPGDVIGFY